MKTVSLVQVNFQQGPKESNSYYLPYSIGMIWSYANSFTHIRQQFLLGEIFFKREKLELSVDKLCSSDIICFSTYVWNRNYNYQLAKKIKKRNPKCILIFGGPEIPITDQCIFEKYPFMDIVVKREGEIIFKEILENLNDLTCVKGIIINRNGKRLDTANRDRIENLDILESPYLNGFFDRLVESNPDIEWAGTLETNRGCPYQCTFCDWGSLTYSKVKQFNLEKVFSELEWMGKNRCGFIFVADANFGIFPERDDLIIDKILATQAKYGYPYTFTFTWAKNQKKEVVKMAEKLINSNSFNNGLTISVQTLNDNVLENIKRKNLNQHKIEEIYSICEEKQIPVLTEIILGLPGETLESWKNNLWNLFEAGNHYGIEMTQVELLENAEMNLLQKEIYDINTTEVYDYLGVESDGILESIRVVNSTRDLCFEDMIEAQFFNSFITTFHISGLSTIVSRFIKKFKNISYEEFYNGFYEIVRSDNWFANQEFETRYYYKKWMIDGKIDHPSIHGVNIHGYNLIYRILLQMHSENKLDHIFNLLENYLKKFKLEEKLEKDLLIFQKNFVVKYENWVDQKDLEFDFDIFEYLQTEKETISQIKTRYSFTCNEDKKISFQKFLELIYFGRRRNFGKYIINNI